MPSWRDVARAVAGRDKDPDSYIENVCNASVPAPDDPAHKHTKRHQCQRERGHGRGGASDPSKKHQCTCSHEW